MYHRQRDSLGQAGLLVRRHAAGLLLYVVGYQLLLAPSPAGYAEELVGASRRW